MRRYWDEPSKNLVSNDTSFRLELDAWRQDIPQYVVEEAPSTYLHPLWIAKLYDYTIVMMMQVKRKNLKQEDINDILSAGVEVCLNYRRLQEEGQLMCYTWAALVFQFRSGILLLYISRLAALDSDSIQKAFDAVCACADSLTCFANRWQDATPYTEVFGYLLHYASWIPEELPSRLHRACSSDELEIYLKQLKRQYLHKEALEMIEDMLYASMQDQS
ncbi:hypothetical protein BBP40_012466 [Aspergillus hancockii]|nr:hypothetical protein BBP40_012466 [Aspergillus hancockii]